MKINIRMLTHAGILLLLLSIGCSKQEIIPDSNTQNNITSTDDNSGGGVISARLITISNPGFEQDKDNWGDVNLFAISTSDKHSGAKSAKLDASGDRIQLLPQSQLSKVPVDSS